MLSIKHSTLYLILTSVLLAGLCGCGKRRNQYPPQTIRPLYEDIAAYASQTPAVRDSLLRTDSLLLSDYMAVLECDHFGDSLLMQISESAPVRVFTPDVRRVYPSLDSIERQLGYILGEAKADGLNIPTNQFAAVVWGRPQSVVFVDSVMLIALNHYLGGAYPGYEGMPAYRRRAKTPQMLPYDLAESLVANAYPLQGADDPQHYPTLLARMIYEGVLTEAKMRLVPDATLEMALDYSPQQLQWLADNEGNMWRMIVTQQMLYDVSPFIAERLLLPSPGTEALNRNAPGRAGRYIGYRIVRSYLDKYPDTPLGAMLVPNFYADQATLQASGYAPK